MEAIVALIRLVNIDAHSGTGTLCIGSYTPSSTTSDDGETSGYGFNCCDNCKWNQDRGSHYARCFQDGRDDHSDNDRCGLWQHY